MATMSSPYSTGTTYFSNGYQPNTINGSKLKKTGKTVGQTGLKGSTSYGGKNMDSQNIWKDGNGNQWIWIRTGDSMGYYIQYNPNYKGKVDFAGGNSASYDKYMVSSKTGTKTTNPTYWKSSADAEYQKTTSSTYKAPEPTPTPTPTPNPTPAPSAPVTNTNTNVVTKTPEPEPEKVVPKIDWQTKDIDEMAKILGIETYKTADILQKYNDLTNKQYDQLDTDVKRAQAENLRALEGTYNDYLNTIRENRANAISNGMTKGAAAAEQLASMYANAQAISESQQKYYDSQYDIAQERATSLAQNTLQAEADRKEIEKYLGELRGTYEANSVNELAARLSAKSQVHSAQIQADANTKAAGITAAANKYAADVGYQSAAYQVANQQQTQTLYDIIKLAQNGDSVAKAYLEYHQKFGDSISK